MRCAPASVSPTRSLEFCGAGWTIAKPSDMRIFARNSPIRCCPCGGLPAPDAASTRSAPCGAVPGQGLAERTSIISNQAPETNFSAVTQARRRRNAGARAACIARNRTILATPFPSGLAARAKARSAQPPAAIQTCEPTTAVAVGGIAFWRCLACCYRGSNILSRRLPTTITALANYRPKAGMFS
jgi:hypothetical protein